MRPGHLTLGELINRLETQDPSMVLPIGFTNPHSYRGYYQDLAFELTQEVTVGSMLADARSALGAPFQGWKGGDFTMSEWTDCWLVREEGECGESVGSVLLSLLLENARP